jgi:H+-transporting ATPase
MRKAARPLPCAPPSVETQALATVVAVYGLFMTPLGWGWASPVWFYALAWFLVTDRVKLLVYRVLDPVKVQPKREAKSPPDAGPQIAG